MQYKYSYYDNGIYIISNEEIASLNQVELTQSFLSEYVECSRRNIEYKENENIGVLYNEIMNHPDVEESVLEAKDSGFPPPIIFIPYASSPYTKLEIFFHKFEILKLLNDWKEGTKTLKIIK